MLPSLPSEPAANAHRKKERRGFLRAFLLSWVQRRAFGSFIPPLLVPGPDAARELMFRSSAVPIPELRVTGGVAVYVSLTTVVESRPRKSANSTRSTRTATARMPSVPPGKLQVSVVVVLVVVTCWSVAAGVVA